MALSGPPFPPRPPLPPQTGAQRARSRKSLKDMKLPEPGEGIVPGLDAAAVDANAGRALVKAADALGSLIQVIGDNGSS